MVPRKAGKILAVVLGASLVVAATAAAGWYWWTVGRYLEATDDAYVQGEVTPIRPKVAGYVRELLVEDNRLVKAGEVLLRIDDREFRLAVAEAEARLDETRAGLANVEARLDLQDAVIAEAAADVAAAEAERERANKELERARDLLRSKVGTRRRYDEALAGQRKAEAAVRRSRARLEQARQRIRVLESERARLRGILAENRAALDIARTRLADTTIVAPLTGVVGNRAVHPGQYVQPGALLLAIVPLERVWIEANFKETQLARMQAGQPVEITVDAYPDMVLSGCVDSFSPASGAVFSLLPPENATGNFTKIVQRIPVKILVDTGDLPGGRLRPGMSVEVTVDTRRHAGAGLPAEEARCGRRP